MSSIINIGIKHSRVNDILEIIKSVYVVKNKISKIDEMNRDEFLGNEGNRTFIVFQALGKEWIELDIPLFNLYELDELLRQITKEYETYAFVGYNQTTNGDFRFALFEGGKLVRSIVQKNFEYKDHSQKRIIDNFGKKLRFETLDLGKPFTKELNREELLDYEILNKWYLELGFTGTFREGVEYLHLEIENFKN